MIKLALLLAAQAAPADQPPTITYVTVCASPDCLNKPVIELDCSVAESDQPWRRVHLIRTGGRAFEVPQSDGGRRFELTALVWSFRDAGGAFENFRQTELNEAEVWFRDADGTSMIFTDRYSRLQDFSSIRIDTFKRADNGKTAKVFVGVCKSTERPQTPLSEDERRRELSK